MPASHHFGQRQHLKPGKADDKGEPMLPQTEAEETAEIEAAGMENDSHRSTGDGHGRRVIPRG